MFTKKNSLVFIDVMRTEAKDKKKKKVPKGSRPVSSKMQPHCQNSNLRIAMLMIMQIGREHNDNFNNEIVNHTCLVFSGLGRKGESSISKAFLFGT